jgi:hypothetical protein
MPPALQEATLTYIWHHLTILVQSEEKEVLEVQQTGYRMTEAEFEDVMQDPIPAPLALGPTHTRRLHVPEAGTWFEETHQSDAEVGSRPLRISSFPEASAEIQNLVPKAGFPPVVHNDSTPSVVLQTSYVENTTSISEYESKLSDCDEPELGVVSRGCTGHRLWVAIVRKWE